MRVYSKVVGPVRAKRVSRCTCRPPPSRLTGGEPATHWKLSIMGRAAALLAIFLLCHLSSGESTTFIINLYFTSKFNIVFWDLISGLESCG